MSDLTETLAPQAPQEVPKKRSYRASQAEHAPQGWPTCQLCGLPPHEHRRRGKDGKAAPPEEKYFVKRRRREKSEAQKEKEKTLIIGIDGEGHGHAFVPHCEKCELTELHHVPALFHKHEVPVHKYKRSPTCKRLNWEADGSRTPCTLPEGDHTGHLYTYLAAVDENGEVHGEARNSSGLTTKECLALFLSLPTKAIFGFSIIYDLTMILADMPDDKLYDLIHEKEREKVNEEGRTVIHAIYWSGYKLNYLNRKLTVQKAKWIPEKNRHVGYGKQIAIWDVFRFFGCKFTAALIDWKVADKKLLERMEEMKSKRSTFDRLTQKEIEDYCKEECAYLAKLVRALIDAHEAIDLPLKSFYGAGSTASAFLEKIGIKEYLADPPGEAMHAVKCAFFGGRFEISRAGPIEQPVWGYDISSAYPYQTTFLPCLIHGKWEHVSLSGKLLPRIHSARLAVCFTVPTGGGTGWGPIPFRVPKEGSIVFPLKSEGTWVWKDEALIAHAQYDARITEAWVYDTACECKPFAAVPDMYRQRCILGKEGPGIVIKLGVNSIYGKVAQSTGSAKFQSWVYAGNITSGCRAQVLELIGLASDPWNILMTATDGVWSLEPLRPPQPRDTGTWDCGDMKDKSKIRKPLGGWEKGGSADPAEPSFKKGVFLARPGIYFPLEATPEQLKEVRARGIAKKVMLDEASEIVAWWKKRGAAKAFSEVYRFKDVQRFTGMKSAILPRTKTSPARRRELYGEWVDQVLEMSFTPKPKRQLALGNLLMPWSEIKGTSAEYDKKVAARCPEAQQAQKMADIGEEQPNGEEGDWDV